MMKYDSRAITSLTDPRIPDGEYPFILDRVDAEPYIDDYDQEKCRYILRFKVPVGEWIKELSVTVYPSQNPDSLYFQLVDVIAKATHMQSFWMREDLIGARGRLCVKNKNKNGKVYSSLDDIMEISLPGKEKFLELIE